MKLHRVRVYDDHDPAAEGVGDVVESEKPARTPADLRALYKKPIAFMRLFHYPPTTNVAQNEFGAAEHKDYGFVTILAQDSTGGLEVRSPGGELVLAPPRHGSFIVNAGDMLSEITAGKIRSAPHRVINRAGIGRYSIPFFYDPDFDARFDSLPQFSAGEFLGHVAEARLV